MQIQIKHQKNKDAKAGLLNVQKQAFVEAMDNFKEAISNHPSELANILTPLYKELIRDPDNISIRFLIAQLNIHCNYFTEAYHELDYIFEINSKHPDLYLLLGKIYYKARDTSLILPLLEKAYKRNIYDSTLIDLLPKIYLENNDTKNAITFYESLLKSNRTDSQCYKILAELYLQGSHFDKAIDTYETLIELSPDMAEHIVKKLEQILITSPTHIKLRKLIVKLHFKTCNPTKATEHLKDMYRYKPDFLSQAIEILSNALKTFPEEPNILQLLSFFKIEISDYSDAITTLTTLYQNDKSKAKVVYQYIGNILKDYPKQVYALQLKVQLETDDHLFSEAIQTLETLLTLDESIDHFDFCHDTLNILELKAPEKHKEAALYTRSYLYYIQEDFNECLVTLNSLLSTTLELKASLLKVKVLEKQNKKQERMDLLKSVLNKFPFSEKLHESISSALHSNIDSLIDNQDDTVTKGLLYLRKGNIIYALECFQKIESSHNHHIQIQTLIGRCFLELGKTDIAFEQFERTLANVTDHSSPLYINTLFYFAITHIHLGKIEKGLTQLEQVERLNINFPKLQALLSYYKSCNILESRFKTCTLIAPLNSEIEPYFVNVEQNTLTQNGSDQAMSFALEHNNKGVSHLISQNINSALTSLNLAIQIDENCVQALCNLSLIHTLKSEYDTAFSQLEKAENSDSTNALIYLNRGLIYYQLNNYGLAIMQFKKALFHQPNLEIATLYIGDVYYKMNKLKEAFEFWNKAQKIGSLQHLVFRRTHYLLIQSLSLNDWLRPFEIEDSDLPQNLINAA
jgi:tetratricopeptide (TPR) repeat protein